MTDVARASVPAADPPRFNLRYLALITLVAAVGGFLFG